MKPGNYLTAINIHDGNSGSLPFRKKALLLYRADHPTQDFEVPMPPGPYFQAKLEADWGMEIDCADIREVLLKDHPQGPVPPPTFIKGFVIIESPASGPTKATIPLDVVAVYTSHGYKIDAKIERMSVSDGALRHGVLYDLLGRVQHHDRRAATVAQFMRRYHVDAAQAERVRALALRILEAVSPDDRDEKYTEADRLMLDWAARLAEIGLSVAHAQYHKHSAYILSNADMPGFSRMEQQRLARIVPAHRGKLGKMQDAGLEGSDWTLVFALRVAALVLRNRSDARFPMLRASVGPAWDSPRFQ